MKGKRVVERTAELKEARARAQQAKPWKALFRLSQLLSRSLELTEVYPAFAAAVKLLLRYDRIGVVVPEGEKLVMALSVAEPPLPSWQGASWLQTEGTAVGWVLDHKTHRLVRDLTTEQSFSDEVFVAREGVRASLMLPLLSGGEPVGVFFLDSQTQNTYTEGDGAAGARGPTARPRSPEQPLVPEGASADPRVGSIRGGTESLGGGQPGG